MKRFLLLVLGATLVLGLAAAGCGDESGGGDPAERIDNAWAKMSETTAVHEEFDMEVEIDGDLSDLGEELADLTPMTIGIAGSADIDMSDEEDIKADMEIELDIQDLLDAMIESSLGDEMTAEDQAGMAMFADLFSDLQIRIVDQTLYMQLLGSWYELPLEQSEIEGITGGISPVEVDAEDVNAQCIQDELTLSKMLKDINEEGSEEVGGEDTTHITASLDTENIVDTIVEVNDKCGGEEMTDDEIADAREILEGMISKADMEFWIDGDDNLRKMSIDMELDLAAAAEAAGSVMDEDTTGSLESMTIRITGTFEQSAFGEEVSVEAPANAMPMEDLLNSFGGLDDTTDGIDDSLGGTDDFDMSEEDLQELEDLERELEGLEEELQNELENLENL